MKRFAIVLLLLLIVLAPLVGCSSSKVDTEREAILAFTRQALAIEAQRDELVNLREHYDYPLTARFFVRGTIDTPHWKDLPGAPTLKAQLVLLDCPPVLQAVKNSLIEIYQLEIEAAQFDAQRRDVLSSSSRAQFFSHINRFNVDSYKKAGVSWISPDFNSPWVIAQELRRDTYIKWSEILHQHAIDEFTGLTTTPMDQYQGATYLQHYPVVAYYKILGIPVYGLNPFQQWQAEQFTPTWATYLASQYLNPSPSGQAPTWSDFIAGVGLEGAGQRAPQLFRQAVGLTPQEQRGFWDILQEGEQMGLIQSVLRGGGYASPVSKIIAARLPALETAFIAEQGANEQASFLDYLIQEYNLMKLLK